MAFLGPENAPRGNGDELYMYTRVRLAWYYRPSDVSDRPVADSRLLLAAIYSEVCDINQIRGKCYVLHRDKIADLAGWKRRPDRFYFTRLFDPYIKKEFEVIQSADVHNLPDHIRETLVSRYEYVVAEKEVIPDLTDNLRLCHTCNTWCAHQESVKCDRCKMYFHMDCVVPPVLAKPAKGYGWTCAPCTNKHAQEVVSHDVRHPQEDKSKSNGRPRGRPRKDRVYAGREEEIPIKHCKMWPFRYFGLYTVAEDTVDPDDLIFPRTATRVGPRYQANVAVSRAAAPPPGIFFLLRLPRHHVTFYNSVEERGGDATTEVLSIVNTLSPAKFEEWKRKLTRDVKLLSSVDWLTEVMHRISDAITAGQSLSSVKMKSPIRVEKWKKRDNLVLDKDWTQDEILAFEDAIAEHGAELWQVQEMVGTRSMPEVVRFYGHWKAAKLGEENHRKRLEDQSEKIPFRFGDSVSAARGQKVGLDEDEGSIITQSSRPISCGACRTHTSKVWWRAPRGLPTSALCDDCGLNWRKYADLSIRPPREESKSRDSEKREGTPLTGPLIKRIKVPPVLHVCRCMACEKPGIIGKVLECKKCHFKAHAGIIGAIVEPSQIELWLCEICNNEQTEEYNLNPYCALCPRPKDEADHSIEQTPMSGPAPDSYLRACKPTEGQCWAHVICAMFLPEVTFTDPIHLRLVEGISGVPQYRWLEHCTLCNEPGGAVVRCADCPRHFHVSCAWKHKYKFGFDVQPVKGSRRDTTKVVTFKGESGCMNPIISCKEHQSTRRNIYEICDTDGDGGMTAFQVYCTNYKVSPVEEAHHLLRKARRLDRIMNIRPDGAHLPPEPIVDIECAKCQVHWSPMFHPHRNTDTGAQQMLCHKCYWFEVPSESVVTAEAHSNGTLALETTTNGISINGRSEQADNTDSAKLVDNQQ
ncbi:hypothetical protein FISHEDRAFT_50335 [Fistulina hepatica ATCC 64428]|uniref:BAH-domain-containing protein n=1 Tax=Fistulina hepatica ATCC 64428 TaxID=1128425 RepID=A0A0D7A4W4_9AGAR|nr:hypothetical protein FISHEDRAFT_50335 [Fistulina hepatica ATCC 64428]